MPPCCLPDVSLTSSTTTICPVVPLPCCQAVGSDSEAGSEAAPDDMTCAICLERTSLVDIALVKGCEHQYCGATLTSHALASRSVHHIAVPLMRAPSTLTLLLCCSAVVCSLYCSSLHPTMGARQAMVPSGAKLRDATACCLCSLLLLLLHLSSAHHQCPVASSIRVGTRTLPDVDVPGIVTHAPGMAVCMRACSSALWQSACLCGSNLIYTCGDDAAAASHPAARALQQHSGPLPHQQPALPLTHATVAALSATPSPSTPRTRSARGPLITC